MQRLAERSAWSDSTGTEVAVLEEQLSQAQLRLAAAELSLDTATASTRALAARLADADCTSAALSAQVRAMELENDDLSREAATLRAELLQSHDQASLFIHWLGHARGNLLIDTAAGADGDDGAGTDGDDSYSSALRDAFQLVEAKFLLYHRLVPLEVHGSACATSNSTSFPTGGRVISKARRAFSAIFAHSQHDRARRSAHGGAPTVALSADATPRAASAGYAVPWVGKARSAGTPSAEHAPNRAAHPDAHARSASQPRRRTAHEGGHTPAEGQRASPMRRMARVDSALVSSQPSDEAQLGA